MQNNIGMYILKKTHTFISFVIFLLVLFFVVFISVDQKKLQQRNQRRYIKQITSTTTQHNTKIILGWAKKAKKR